MHSRLVSGCNTNNNHSPGEFISFFYCGKGMCVVEGAAASKFSFTERSLRSDGREEVYRSTYFCLCFTVFFFLLIAAERARDFWI